MTAPRIHARVEHFKKQAIGFIQRLDEWTHGWIGIIGGAVWEALKPDSAIKAAAIAYFSVLSLFPLALVSISIASLYLGPLMDQGAIIEKLEFIAPALGQLLGQNIDEIIQARGPVTSIALLGLIWSASTIFNLLTVTMHGLWANKRHRPVWKRRGLAILLVLALAGPILFLASFASSMITNLRTWLPVEIIPIGDGIIFILAILLDITFFLGLYIMLPHGTSTWRENFPGAVIAGVLWELAKKAFLSIVSTYISVTNLIYGSVAAIIAFLAWAYVSGIIFLFGAYISVAYFQHKKRQQELIVETETPQ